MADFFERLFATITIVGGTIGVFGAFSYVSIRSIGTGPVSDISYTAGIMIVGFSVAIIGGLLLVIYERLST